jgi:catechol 2,3-dioxygenase-like lactoylglutathione lyase family enzyme
MNGTVLSPDHLHLVSQDPLQAAAWYVQNLGAEIKQSQEVQGSPQVYVTCGGLSLIIRGQRPGEELQHRPGLQWGLDHFGFLVTGDFDVFCAELRKKGVRFATEPMDYSPVLRLAFIEAPDGVLIELLLRKK